MLVAVFVTMLFLACGTIPQEVPALDVARELRALVQLVDPAARSRRANELARRAEIAVDEWRAAMAAFAAPAEMPADVRVRGTSRIRAPLWNGETLEDTELWIHVPESYAPGTPAPLLHAAHGTGGSGRGEPEAWRAIAEQCGMLVVAPSEGGANEGYAFSPRERELALSAVRWMRLSFDVDESRVLLTGTSRGGHLTWDLALRFPDRWAAIAPCIGGPRLNPDAGQNNLRFAENVVGLSIRDLQGAQDDPRMLFNLGLLFDDLRRLGARDAELVTFPDRGHDFDPSAVDWVAWFGAVRRAARPAEVVRIAANERETRAWWAEIVAVDPREVQDTVKLRVPASVWERLDDEGQRRLVHSTARERTARLQVRFDGPGRFTATTRHVKAFRLLLEPDMLGDKGVVAVSWNGRLRKKTVAPSRAVLLREFAERFDRTFLPVGECELR